jgi:eukaryotic-like serine/threonine-protein kinase
MALAPGTMLGPYEIDALIGGGGMGEVYRARDTRLNRIVAIKTLPQFETSNPQLRLRVEQEARIVAAISHPHICALFDIGREGQIDYFVMEFLEGETLAERMRRELLPLDVVLRYGMEIAAALAAAHRHGVVHCDLTPANVMLTRNGVKLLDFGIAQLRAGAAGRVAAMLTAESPTTEAEPTRPGFLGTLYYTTPEQLQGRPVDARTDIFALGVVLYQMVAGRRPFQGATQADLIAAILHADPPPLESLPSRAVPDSLAHLIRICLAKNADDRWQSAQDVERELAFLAVCGAPGGFQPAGHRRHPRTPWLLLAGAAAAALPIAVALQPGWASDPPPSLVRFDVLPVPPATLTVDHVDARVAPNGRHLAFTARHRGTTTLWLRSLDAHAARELPGTEGATQPFWSPDSRSIGFYAMGALKRVSLGGGAVHIVCPLPAMAGAGWSPRGVILFSQLNALGHVPDHGGTPVLLPPPAVRQADAVLVWPQFLPDGHRYLFRIIRGPRASQGVYVGSLNGGDVARVLDTTGSVTAAGNYLLSVRAGTLLAQPFDLKRLAPRGEPVVLADQVMENLGEVAGPAVSASGTGVLAYRPRHAFPTTLTWFDRGGRSVDTLSTPPGCRNPEVAHDGRQVAVECPDLAANARDIWVFDAISRRPARLTTHPADDSDPVWSPDARWIVFASGREGARDLYRRLSTGEGEDELLLRTTRTKYPNSWSRDGRFILFTSREADTGWDIWLLPLGGEAEPLVSTPAAEIEPQFSPDGRWLAYTSDESGRLEVFVRPFRAAGRAWLISTDGGSDPRWRDDGGELYYLSPDRVLMAVPVSTRGEFNASAPRPLFQTRTSGPLGLGVRFNYAAGPGGRQFLVTADVPEAVPSPFRVVLNWTSEVPPSENRLP